MPTFSVNGLANDYLEMRIYSKLFFRLTSIRNLAVTDAFRRKLQSILIALEEKETRNALIVINVG